MIKCMLCGEEFSQITWSHLKSAHNMDTSEYRRMFPNASMMSEEMYQAMSEAQMGNQHALGHVCAEEAKQAMSKAKLGNQNALGNMYVRTEETKQAVSKAMLGNQNALGYIHTEEAKRKVGEAQMGNQHALGYVQSEKTKQLRSEAMLGKQNALGYIHTEEAKQRMSESMKETWEDPEFQQRWSEGMHMKPNEPELQLQCTLDKHFPGEWRYVGDGRVRLGRHNPDFININGKKQVIEVFGVYWHDPDMFPNRLSEEELIAYYKDYGFDCLVFWEYDVYIEDEVVERVSKWQQ